MNFDMRQHLESRFFTPDLYTGVTVTDNNMTVILWNLSGQMCGYQVYSPLLPKKAKVPVEAKYFTHITSGQNAVWGLETVDWDSAYIFITEGIFDACRLHRYGLPAVAVLGSNPQHLVGWFKSLSQTTVACCQGDKAGLLLSLTTDCAIYLPEGHDVSDLDEDKFYEMFSPYVDPPPIV